MTNDWQAYYYSKDDGTMPVKEYIDSLSKESDIRSNEDEKN
jgi:hypothetical protein